MSKNTQSHRKLRGRLLVSTATAACGMALLASPAQADTIPPECDVNGTEVTCVVPAPATVGDIKVTSDDTTLTIGDPAVPTAVVANGYGIAMTGEGAQSLIVADGSSVTSQASIGAFISVNNPGSTASVGGNGNFTGATGALTVSNNGPTATSVRANNLVTQSGNALRVSAAGTIDVDIAGIVASGDTGLYVTNFSNGDATLVQLNSLYAQQSGIVVRTQPTAGVVRIAVTGDIEAQTDVDGNAAILVDQQGTGGVYIDTQGSLRAGAVDDYAAYVDVTGDGELVFSNEGAVFGQTVLHNYSDGNLTAEFNVVEGDIIAVTSGAGDLTVRVDENMAGDLLADGDGGAVRVETSGTVTGDYAIQASNANQGGVTVLAGGTIVADSVGISAGSIDGGDILIDSQAITAIHGISASNSAPDSVGDITINAHGDIDASGTGISAYVGGDGDIAIEAGNVKGVLGKAIGTAIEGQGSTFIHTTGFIDGGVAANHDGNGDVEIVTEDAVASSSDGIEVLHGGDGNVLVDAQGDITSQGYGVYVDRGANTSTFGDGDITIATGAVDAGQSGIAALHEGNGDIAVDVTGPIAAEDHGVLVAALGDTGNVSVHTADTVTATDHFGVYVNSQAVGDVSVTTDAVVSGLAAINVEHYGAGDVSIQANADLDGSLGVLASGNIDVDVSGNIVAREGIDEALLINAVGDGSTLADVTVSGDITGTYNGLRVSATNGAALSLDVGGTVSGSNDGANITAGSVDLTLAAVEAGETAINLVSFGNASASIGAATGGTYGFYAEVEGDLTLDIGDATGATQSGIEAYVGGSIDATIRGHVVGSDAGVLLYGAADQVWNVAIAEGALLESYGAAFAMVAQAGTGQLFLTNQGTINGADGAGMFLSDSSDGDRFDNYGLITGAIAPGQGDDVIVNMGTIEGTFWDIGGNDTFLNTGIFRGAISDPDGMTVGNAEGGLFEVLYTLGLDLGGGTMTNAGTFSSGGSDNIFTTNVNGSFVQDASGTMLVDVDGATGTADRLDIVGDATLAGSVGVNFVTPTAPQQEFLIAQTIGGDLVDAGLTLGTQVQLSPLVTLGLDFRSDKDLYLTSVVDFTPDDANLNPNQEEIAGEIDDLFGDDPDALGDLNDGLFDLDNLDDYADALNQLVPEIYLNTQQTSLLAAQNFSSELGGCSGRDGSMLADGKGCAKLVMGGDLFERDASFEQIGFEDGTLKLQAAYFTQLSETLTLGVGLGYDDTLVKNDVLSKAQGHRFEGGASLTYRSDGFALGGTVSAGFTNYDVTRRIFFGDFASQSEGNQHVRTLTGELAASYTADLGNLYIKPAATLVATHLRSSALVETGGTDTDYAIDRKAEWHLAARPSIEIGGDIAHDTGLRIQPYVRGGATVLFDEDFALTGRFANAGDLGDGFATTTELDRTTIDLDAGFRFVIGKNSALNAEYVGRFSDEQRNHGFRVRASFAF